MEIQVSKPQTRDQEPDLSSKSFWTIHQVISSCLILTSCFDSSFLSPQGFCLSFNHVRLWNTPVASIPLSGDIFQCGTKELGPLPLSWVLFMTGLKECTENSLRQWGWHLLLVVQTLQKKVLYQILMISKLCLEPQGAVWTFYFHRSEESRWGMYWFIMCW